MQNLVNLLFVFVHLRGTSCHFLSTPAKKGLVALSLVIAVLSQLSGCGEAEATDNQEQEKEAVISVPVEVSKLQQGNISSNYCDNRST